MQKKMKKNKAETKPRGFSLVELSIIIIIIGIFAAGIFVADKMISKFRLKTAESLTRSSPIVSITQNNLWLETTLESSFNGSEADNNKSISSWNDQSKSGGTKSSVVKVGLGPTYSNTINRLHAVKFDAISSANPSATNHLKIEDASYLNNTDYTIFVLEKRQSSSSNNYFIGESPNGTSNQTLTLGYSADSTVIHSQGSSTSYDSNVSSYSNSTDKPRLFSFVHSGTGGNKTYINGVLAGEDATKTTHLNSIEDLVIGKGYTGEIGEVAIFTKALNNESRTSIEDYLAKKWERKNNRLVVANGSCTTGTVTDTGCSKDCYTSSINGVTSPSVVTDGQTNITATCGAAGYSGAITVSCPAGTGVIAKSGNCGCDTVGGYSPVGDTCVAQCAFSGSNSIVGILTSTTPATPGTGLTQSCNALNFKTTDSISFDCIAGSITNASGSCTCDDAYTLFGGVCQPKCTFSGSNAKTGITTSTTVNYTATAAIISCNDTANNFSASDSFNYTCIGGNIAVTSGACDTCESTHTFVGGVCQPKCTFSGSNARIGVTDSTTVNYATTATSQSCNNSAGNFNTSDTFSYTCIGGNIAVTAGACDTCATGYNFNGTECVPPLTCTGGVMTCTAGSLPNCIGGNVVHTFTVGGAGGTTLNCTAGSTDSLSVLIVGGGGGGGRHVLTRGGGGGGGGQVKTLSGRHISGGDVITVSVGALGSGSTADTTNGVSGQSSSVSFTTTSSDTLAASNKLVNTLSFGGGGGGGAGANLATASGPAGGSSGRYVSPTIAVSPGGVGDKNGGDGILCGSSCGFGGGGGSTNVKGFNAESAGGCTCTSKGGAGAEGVSSLISGTSRVYGSGGGGGGYYTSASIVNGGTNAGMGGYGGLGPTNAVANLGGGGGGSNGATAGSSSNPTNGGNGAGGVVIFAYPRN
jgi:hypothetical protein